jgi:hypothetical protein
MDTRTLGSLDPNGTLVTEMTASTEPDLYWYDFELRGIPANCSVQVPITDSGGFFKIPSEIRSASGSPSTAHLENQERYCTGVVRSLPRSTFPKCVVGSESTKITSRGHL